MIEYNSCMHEVKNQLMIQTLVLFILNVVELLVPLIKSYVKNKLHMLKGNSIIDMDPESVFKLDLDKEKNNNEISNDYLEIVVQFGLIFTFGVAYPLCFLLA
mmetsp:Transcript_45053/g.37964  ORF Transcript_45053/g.37964 Transcript_45053/m.37964 type:complete len:102 (+) Transcript_45053:1648-1953(+)